MEEKKKLPLWAALVSYGIGFLWVCSAMFGFPWMESHSYDHTFLLLFAAVFFLWAGFSLKHKPHLHEHWFWMACTMLIGLAIAMKRLRAVDAFGYLAMHGFAAYWVLCYAGILTEQETSPFVPLDLLETMVLAPFGGFFLRVISVTDAVRICLHELLSRNHSSRMNKKTIAISAAVVLAAFPLFLLAGGLLGQADKTFANLTSGFLSLFTLDWECPIWAVNCGVDFLFGLPVGAYLFGLVGTAYRRNASRFDAGKLTSQLETLRFAPMGALCIVFCAFCGLYLLFFGVQAGHLLGAFRGNVPGTLTAAEYAREGFFQLCKVMCINFLLLALAAKLGKSSIRTHTPLKTLCALLMVESVFLAVSAASKLGLYIQRFGFTPMRLLSFWGIGVLTAGSVLALWSLRKPCKAVQKLIWFAAGTFTLLCFY